MAKDNNSLFTQTVKNSSGRRMEALSCNGGNANTNGKLGTRSEAAETAENGILTNSRGKAHRTRYAALSKASMFWDPDVLFSPRRWSGGYATPPPRNRLRMGQLYRSDVANGGGDLVPHSVAENSAVHPAPNVPTE